MENSIEVTITKTIAQEYRVRDVYGLEIGSVIITHELALDILEDAKFQCSHDGPFGNGNCQECGSGWGIQKAYKALIRHIELALIIK